MQRDIRIAHSGHSPSHQQSDPWALLQPNEKTAPFSSKDAVLNLSTNSSRQTAQEKLGSFSDEANRVAKALDCFCCVIRNFNAELFFERHNQLNCVKAISA
jgi:hypothetical protein